MKIEYYAREVYGVTRYYIVDEHIEKAVLGLMRRKTMETKDILFLTALGHEMVQVLPRNGKEN